MDRLAELQHHVVGRVDDVADGALAGSEQAHLDAVRRRADRHAAHPAPDEPRAQVRVPDVHDEAVRDARAAPLLHRDLRQADLLAGGRGDLAGEAQDGQRVAAVGLDVHVEDDVAVQVDQRDAERRVAGQDQDARRRRP